MVTNNSFHEVLSERFTSLPPKQQAVAQLLAEDPSFVAFASAAEVAERAGVDTATVVRTCQSLGYSGWREFHQHARRLLAGRPTFDERVAALRAPDQDITGRIFEVARDNVAETFNDLDREAFERVAAAISESGIVVVAAGGVSAGPGEYLTSSLRIIGCRALLTTGAGDTGPALATLTSNDVVVAISMWRYLQNTIDTLRHAAETRGATTVAITDSAVSPAALLAQHALVARTHTAGPRMSLTGVMALLEALVARVAILNPARSRAASNVASRFYFKDNALGSPDEGPGGRDDWHEYLAGEAGEE